VVQLKSGGYVVINQTEALVAIDVNSGRSTKERHIEETALKTNLEAAEEIARQLRLRDLAGLIVIDFIDMEESRNNAAVERRLKEVMRSDRSRIQLGKISAFGLLELSRQRLRPSLMETSFQPCTHCNGTGVVRSVESSSVRMLRMIEEEGVQRRSSEITVTVNPSIALYILNQKRSALAEIEARYGLRVQLWGDENLVPPAFRMDKVKAETSAEAPQAKPIVPYQAPEPAEAEKPAGEEDQEAAAEAEPPAIPTAGEAPGEDADGARRRRRRRRRRGRREGVAVAPEAAAEGESAEAVAAEADDHAEAEASEKAISIAEGEPLARRRRRGKRGGRRRHRPGEAVAPASRGDQAEATERLQSAPGSERLTVTPDEAMTDPAATPLGAVAVAEAAAEAMAPEPSVKPKRSRSRKKPAGPAAEAVAEVVAEAVAVAIAAVPPAKPKRKRSPRRPAAAGMTGAPSVEPSLAATGQPLAGEPEPVFVLEPSQPEPEAAPVPAATEAETPPASPELVAASPQPPAEMVSEPAHPRRRGWWNRLVR
jgi:ribonuclease E